MTSMSRYFAPNADIFPVNKESYTDKFEFEDSPKHWNTRFILFSRTSIASLTYFWFTLELSSSSQSLIFQSVLASFCLTKFSQ